MIKVEKNIGYLKEVLSYRNHWISFLVWEKKQKSKILLGVNDIMRKIVTKEILDKMVNDYHNGMDLN